MLKRRGIVGLLSVLAILSFVSHSFAQKQTGSIIGTVRDSGGETLPGVNISIKSPNLIQSVLSTLSTQKGSYRFVNLPPGFYSLTAELPGFKKSERKEIRIFVGETTTININMELGTVAEVVNVTAANPTVDVTKSEVSTVLTTEMLTALPYRAHDLGFVDLAPGVADRAASGSSPGANQYQLDGQNITDQWWGTDTPNINYDIIEESEVTTAGGKAEYGEYTGAVVNAVTKSGGNTLKGQASMYFYNNHLVSHRTNEIAPPAASYDGSFLLGGPILKDRLWFFLAAAYRNNTTKSLAEGATPTTVNRPYIYGKINYLANKNNKGFLSFEWCDIKTDQGIDAFRSPVSLQTRLWKTILVNFQHELTFNANTFLEAKVNYKKYKGFATPTHPELPFIYDLATGYRSGAGVDPNGDDTRRGLATVTLTHFAEDWLLGTHEFKFGATVDIGKGTNYFGYPDGQTIFLMNGVPVEKYVADHNEIEPEGINEYTAFAQDSWTIMKRLTLNLGLRFSDTQSKQLDVATPSGVVKARGQLFKWVNIAPRLGLSYALTKDNKTALRMSWGRFYDANNYILFYGYGPYSQTVTSYYWDPNTSDWVFSNIQGPATNQDINPNLKRAYSDVFTLGIQRQLFENFSVELNYVHKYFGNQIAYINTEGQYAEATITDPVTGDSITAYNQTNPGENFYYLTNPANYHYKYDGVDFIATKRFSHNWFVQASFHWQKCEGLGTNDVEGHSGYTNILKDPNNQINAFGPETNDRTYIIRFLASYYIKPIGLNAAAVFNHIQGPRYSRQIETLLNQGYVYINAVPRNFLLGNPLTTLDLRFEKMINISRFNIALILDIRNVFNGDNPTSLSTVYGTDLIPTTLALQDPRYFQLGARIGF
jgi:hypothetical protein